MHESIWSVPGSCQVRGAEKIKKVTFPHFLQERLDSVDHLLLCFPSRQSFGSIPTFFAIAFCPETQRLTSQQSEAVRQAPLQRVSGREIGWAREYNWIEVKRIPCKPTTSIVCRQQKSAFRCGSVPERASINTGDVRPFSPCGGIF